MATYVTWGEVEFFFLKMLVLRFWRWI